MRDSSGLRLWIPSTWPWLATRISFRGSVPVIFTEYVLHLHIPFHFVFCSVYPIRSDRIDGIPYPCPPVSLLLSPDYILPFPSFIPIHSSDPHSQIPPPLLRSPYTLSQHHLTPWFPSAHFFLHIRPLCPILLPVLQPFEQRFRINVPLIAETYCNHWLFQFFMDIHEKKCLSPRTLS